MTPVKAVRVGGVNPVRRVSNGQGPPPFRGWNGLLHGVRGVFWRGFSTMAIGYHVVRDHPVRLTRFTGLRFGSGGRDRAACAGMVAAYRRNLAGMFPDVFQAGGCICIHTSGPTLNYHHGDWIVFLGGLGCRRIGSCLVFLGKPYFARSAAMGVRRCYFAKGPWCPFGAPGGRCALGAFGGIRLVRVTWGSIFVAWGSQSCALGSCGTGQNFCLCSTINSGNRFSSWRFVVFAFLEIFGRTWRS